MGRGAGGGGQHKEDKRRRNFYGKNDNMNTYNDIIIIMLTLVSVLPAATNVMWPFSFAINLKKIAS